MKTWEENRKIFMYVEMTRRLYYNKKYGNSDVIKKDGQSAVGT